MTFIITNDSVGLLMDARRYDKNADQLAQILWNLNRLNTKNNALAALKKEILISVIDDALQLNDDLGKMAEQGLI